jgi:hypothetical protein
MGRPFTTVASESFKETLDELGVGRGEATPLDPRALGRRGALVVAGEAVWKEHLGPLLEAKQVREVLGVGTRQAVSDLRSRGRLLGLTRQDTRVVYPAFQFGSGGRPFPELPEILDHFDRSEVDRWTVASWFVTPQALLNGQTPVQWLRGDGDRDRVVQAARRTASRLGR